MNDKKTIKNLKALLNKNADSINRIVASNSFMNTVCKYDDIVNIYIHEGDEGIFPFLEGIPVIMSQTITKGAILETKDESIIITI